MGRPGVLRPVAASALPDHIVRVAGGRRVAADDRGRIHGATVLFLHPAPGSRRFDPDPWATAVAGVRLVTFDRPGYGASEPLARGVVPTITGFADDAADVVERLDAGPVAAVGWSAGGLVALALAARHPALVRHVVMIATPAHEDDVARLSDDHKAMVAALRPDLTSASDTVAAALAPIAHSTRAMLDLLGSGPADEQVRRDLVNGPRLETMAAEAVRQGVAGVAADIVASTVAPWGFDPQGLPVSATLWYGEEDELVPPEHGAYWAGALPNAELRVVPKAGHFLPLLAWRDILRSAVAG